MKLAYFSPLGPQRSGISDYSEELLPSLSKGADITLFVDGFKPSNRELLEQFKVCDYRRDPSLLRSLTNFDAIVYHMGNDHRYHAGILDCMFEHPGIVVFHDFALQDFFLGLARQRDDLRLYLDEVAGCHGPRVQLDAAQALALGSIPSIMERPLDFPLNCRIARAAEAIVVHSRWSQSRLSEIAPAVPVSRVAMPAIPPTAQRNRPAADDEVHLATFGLITPGKCIEHALRALATLKATHRFRYTLVGEPNPFFEVRKLIQRYGMEDFVSITGHLPLGEFEQHIVNTDIALNMRERTVGETSASLCRILAGGVCSIVSDVGWYAELPNDTVVKVGLDGNTDALLSAYLQRLIEDETLRRRIGENARRYALAEHNVATSAELYLAVVRSTIARRTQRQLVGAVSPELAILQAGDSPESFLRGVAEEIALLTPPMTLESNAAAQNGRPGALTTAASENGTSAAPAEKTVGSTPARGRLAKIEDVDYKRAASEYLSRLSEERRHHLRTKPFYNLANKPTKYKGEGMDEDMHRHFCDFANIAMTLALPPGSRILDVGCGSGWLSEYFARLGHEVSGIDISSDLIEMSRERLARVPYGVDHETPLRCTFAVHDIELTSLPENFDAIICYDSLHHFEDERAVVKHLSEMLEPGGLLFILEGERPAAGSASEEELRAVMHEFQTLESPFDSEYLRELLADYGFAVVGDYVSVNGLFDREILEDNVLPLKKLATNYHYLFCKKVAHERHASTVPDSRQPGILRADIRLRAPVTEQFAPRETLSISLAIENTGDTLWLTGQTARTGIVMPAVRVFDSLGTLVSEFHGEPPLPRPVAPGETANLRVEYVVPQRLGKYTLKFDLVDQQVCWFERQGSEPLLIHFEVR
jgi:2-polyprenyl-3-methyl-5-hydroxy-6-metoxy-1,4-benzoquinol methylase/glycosyltransferase involved in cell wall biosynthesis